MNRRIVAALLAGLAVPAQAQVGRSRAGSGEPDYWVGLSYGYVEGVSITDGDSNTSWQFGYSSQIRATIEKTIQRGVTVGAAAGFSTAPLTYQANAFGNPCAGTCQANADITQYTAFVRGGSGNIGFHGMYTLEGGITQFSKFRDRLTGDNLPPSSSKNDVTFGFGGGLGYGFSTTSDLYVGEQFFLILHPQGGTTTTSAPRMLTFRAGVRVGF